MRLLFVRHGEMDFGNAKPTDLDTLNELWNLEWQAGLSPRGQRDAIAVADYFRRRALDGVYASHLLRARETAAVTAELRGLEVQVREDLTELKPGHLPERSAGGRFVAAVNGLPGLDDNARIGYLAPALISTYFLTWLRGRTWGGETFHGLRARIERTLAHLRQTHRSEDTVALFSHGYFIFYLAGWCTELSPARLQLWRKPQVANCSITELELGPDGPPTLLRFADTSHLPR